MEKCPYCGQEYSDDNSVCPIDETPLEPTDPKLAAPPSDAEPNQVNIESPIEADDAPTQVPDGFHYLGRFDAFEADHLLKKFSETGIRFQLENIERRVFRWGGEFSGTGYEIRNWIEIFVAIDDEENAMKILSADWKV